MEDYTSLKIVRALEFGWIYYPNGLSTGFGISKGYFTFDTNDNKLTIIEDGRSQRPKVELTNITLEDLYLSQAETGFATFADLQNTLTLKGCPLAVDVIEVTTGASSGINKVFYTGADITVVPGFSGSVVNLNDTNATVTYTVAGTLMTITSGANNGDALIF